MGIYRTLLEEEIPHLDKNNSPDDQIEELKDVIEDQDANQAEQDAAQDAAFGPDCGVDDILDESAMAIYEFEMGHNEIMQALGIHELSEACNGRDIIIEAADIKGFFASIGKKIKAFFTKVWSVLNRWMGNLKAVFTSNKKFYGKFSKQINDGYNIVKADKTRKEMEGYAFTNVKAESGDNKSVLQKALKNVSSVDSMISALADGRNNDITINKAMDAEKLEEALNGVRGDYCNASGGVGADEYSKKLKEYIYGEKSKTWMSPDAIKTAMNNDYTTAVKSMMTDVKNQMSTVNDKIKKMKSMAEKIEDGTTRNKVLAICTRYFAFVRGVLVASETWRSARLSGINAYARQARRYAMTYVAASNKSTHKGFQKESTEYGFLGAMGLV